MSKKPRIWVFGNAVQDLTVDLDLQRLEPDNPRLLDVFTFAGNDPLMAKGTILHLVRQGETRLRRPILLDAGGRDGGVEETNLGKKTYYKLVGGQKYTLSPDPHIDTLSETVLNVPIKSIAWGGGGINVLNTICSLSPTSVTPLHYSDIGMPIADPRARDLAKVFIQTLLKEPGLGKLMGKFAPTTDQSLESHAGTLVNHVLDMLGPNTETLYRHLLTAMNAYTADESLEVYLTQKRVSFTFYRDDKWEKIRNVAIAQITGKDVDIRNKIIFRGSRGSLGDAVTAAAVIQKLDAESPPCSVIMLNTIYNDKYYEAAISIAKKYAENQKARLVIAMTDSILKRLTPSKLEEIKKHLHGATLIFNESEFCEYLRDIVLDAPKLNEDLKNGKLPNVDLLKDIANKLIDRIGGLVAEVYVTLGPYGSLGITPNGKVIYVGTFGGNQRPIYDTNGCGDAYAGAVTMLQYHKGGKDGRLAEAHSIGTELDEQEEEMLLTMAVATATAYAKATSPSGAIRPTDVISYLRSEYLPYLEVGQIGFNGNVKAGATDEAGRLAQPPSAKRIGYTRRLAEIIKE